MGNSESSNPVRNMDKRTARREYKDDFINAIQRYRKAYIQSHATKNSNIKPSFSTWDDNSIRVFARKRPIFSHEIESDEYDVITCHQDTIIIHDARMHTDMKRQFINHHEFQFDYVFNEWETNQSVYEIFTKPLVEIACEGGFSTALVYGQTGSGKTFTMSSMYSQAADEIFHFLHKKVERFSNSLPIVTVAFIEIAGDNVHDLLNAFTPTQLRSAGDGSVHAFPVTEPRVTNKEELLAVVQHGLNIRTTAATGVHDASSRSHAILKIYIQRTDLRNKNGTNDVIEGTLTLVDLAGSEHRIDSMYHGKERRKETSHINASLMALKECIRAKAMGTSQSHQHVFRKSKLTMALKNSFNLPHARTIVIATVSPASKDTEHSLNTLRHACIMHGQENEEGGSTGDKETRFVTGGKITTDEIGEINIARIAKRNFEKKKSNNGALDELKTNNGNQVETKLAKAANKEIEITDKMKRKMRRLSENKSFVTLDESIQRLLKTSRERLGKEERQFARLQVASGNSGSANNNPDYETLQRIVEEERDERKVSERDSSEDEGVQDGVDQSHSKKQQQQPFARNSLDQDFAALYEDDFENVTPRSSANHGDVKPSIAHKPVGGSTGKSSSQYSRVPFEKIFECIFIAKDSVPLSILLMQLRAMLKVHHYSTEEIEHFINKEVKGKGSTTGSSTPQKNNARPTTPRRPATPQRPLSASRSGSSSSVNQANDRSRSNSHTHSQPNNKTPNRRMSNGSNVSNYAHGKSTMADSDNETYSSANDNSSVSRSHRPQAGISKMSSADREREEKMLHAKQQLELEAQQRKQRQEAARQFRQEQEQHKVNQIMTKSGINPNNNNAKRQQMMLMLQKKSFEEENERRIQKEIEEHQQEIHRLNQLIEIDRTAKTTDEKLSMAQKFGVKKQLALHKAAILKAERKKASLGENLSVVSVAGGGGGGGTGAGGSSGYDDEPSPSEMRRSLSRDSVAGHQNSRPVVDFDDMVVPTHSRSAGGVNGGNAEKKSIRTDASGSGGNGNGSGNNMRFYGASGGGEGVKKRPEWNFDVPSDSAFSNDSIAEHNTADSGKDSDDLPLISERGRPLSMRMAQQMAKRNPAAPQY